MEFRTTIRNAAGPRPSLFIPDGAFDVLIKRQIIRLKGPSIRAAELVKQELLRIISTTDIPELSRFPALRERVVSIAEEVLDDCAQPAFDMISALIDCELAYINTSHPDFVGSIHGSLLKEEILKETPRAQQKSQKPSQESSGFFSRVFGSSKPKQIKNKHNNESTFDTDTIDNVCALHFLPYFLQYLQHLFSILQPMKQLIYQKERIFKSHC